MALSLRRIARRARGRLAYVGLVAAATVALVYVVMPPGDDSYTVLGEKAREEAVPSSPGRKALAQWKIDSRDSALGNDGTESAKAETETEAPQSKDGSKRSERERSSSDAWYVGTQTPALVSIADINDPTVTIVPHPSSLTVTKSRRLCADIAPAVGRQNVVLVIGISTVRRPTKQYVLDVISRLIRHIDQDDEADVLILVQLADELPETVELMQTELRQKFAAAISSGLLEIVQPLADTYPTLRGLKRNYNDNDARVRWRSKQCVDFGHIMAVGSTRGKYYMQLEDDMFALQGYARSIIARVERLEEEGKRWVGLNVHPSGFTAKLFRAADAAELAVLFKTFYAEKPVDFIIFDFISLKVGGADGMKDLKPSPFSHMGEESTLAGQKREALKLVPLMDKVGYDPPNPEAKLESNMEMWVNFDYKNLWSGRGFFWAAKIKANQYLLATFQKPQRVTDIEVGTGFSVRPGDILENGEIEVLMGGEWRHAAEFVSGAAHAEFKPPADVSAVRVRALRDQSPWVLFSVFRITLAND